MVENFRNQLGTGRVAWVALAGVVGLLAMFVFVRALFDESETEGVRISAQTMVPTSVNPVGDAECPEGPAASPYDFLPDGALAEKISVYQEEIIAVRVDIAPFRGPMPEQVHFDASWLSDLVVDSSPICAFVVSEDDVASTLEWTRTGPAAATFEVRNALRWTPTVIEVWLEAANPVDSTVIRTDIVSDLEGDRFVIDPLGGNKRVERRSGVTGEVGLETGHAEIVDNTITLSVLVENPTENDWVFDADLELTTDLPGLGWTTTVVPTQFSCTVGGGVTCDLGDLAPGERYVIETEATVPDESIPTALQCLNEIHRAGVCVAAELTNSIGGVRSSASTELFFAQTPRSTGSLEITSEPPIVSRRPDETPQVRILVRGPGADVSGVDVVASDCVGITRSGSDLDDGDAFLEVDEAWAYDCVLDSELTGDFRVDFTARRSGGRAVTGTYVSSVEIVDPAVVVAPANETDRGMEFTLTNTGIGDVFEVAVLIPGCESQFFDPPLTGPIRQLQTAVVVCSRGEVDPAGIVVFGTDASGRPFVSRSTSN